MNEIILMSCVLFGVACMVAPVWLFVDLLNANEGNLARIRRLIWGAVYPECDARCLKELKSDGSKGRKK